MAAASSPMLCAVSIAPARSAVLKILELPRRCGNAGVEDVPGDCAGLAQNFCGLLRIAARLVAKASALRIDLDAALHDHRLRDQDVMRCRDRPVSLVGARTGKPGAERLTPQNRITAVAGMTEIERVRHLRYEAAHQLGIATVTVAGKDQGRATNSLARAVAPNDLNAAHTTIGLCQQPVGDDFCQDDDLALLSGMSQAVDKLPARAAGQTVHAQG